MTVLDGEDGVDLDGEVTQWDEDTGGSDWANDILFCGYRYDPETSLYHVRHRMYHSALGRWLQRDPLGYVDGMGLYQYVGSMPGAATDPEGLAFGPSDYGMEPLGWSTVPWEPTTERRCPLEWDFRFGLVTFGPGPFGGQVVETFKVEWITPVHMLGGQYWNFQGEPFVGKWPRGAGTPGWGDLGDAELVAKMLLAFTPLGISGCSSCEPVVTTVRNYSAPTENLAQDGRYGQAMGALRACTPDEFPGPAGGYFAGHKTAPSEIKRDVAGGTIEAQSMYKGEGITVHGTLLSNHPDYNAGDLAMELYAEWQRRPGNSHNYRKGWDEMQMNIELYYLREALKKYAGTHGEHYAPTEMWRHPVY